MGICASCLGLRQHEPQDEDLDHILNSDQTDYGTIAEHETIQPDEDELRREREALQNITANAADNMIDVLHPSHSEQNLTLRSHSKLQLAQGPDNQGSHAAPTDVKEDVSAEEAAWLESIKTANVGVVHAPRRGRLVMDVNLRDGQKSTRSERAY